MKGAIFIVAKKKLIKCGSWFGVIVCLLLGAYYIVLASPLNPKSLRFPDIDSSVFIYHGYGLRAGMTPYIDMVDHKGPLLYTIEWLGLTLGNGSMLGIWALEWIMMFVSLFLMFLCARFFVTNRAWCLFAVGTSMVPIVYLYQGGEFNRRVVIVIYFVGLMDIFRLSEKWEVNFGQNNHICCLYGGSALYSCKYDRCMDCVCTY